MTSKWIKRQTCQLQASYMLGFILNGGWSGGRYDQIKSNDYLFLFLSKMISFYFKRTKIALFYFKLTG
jgi:hypothetical protein